MWHYRQWSIEPDFAPERFDWISVWSFKWRSWISTQLQAMSMSEAAQNQRQRGIRSMQTADTSITRRVQNKSYEILQRWSTGFNSVCCPVQPRVCEEAARNGISANI